MKAKMLVVFALLALGFSSASAQFTPTCQIGTKWSVNPGRQLAPGESFVVVPGGIVTITQRETPGSSHIVFRRCVLPPQEVAVGGILPWVKACGQDFVPEGWTIPGMRPRDGRDGFNGTDGTNGRDAKDGRDGTNGRDAATNQAPVAPQRLGFWCFRGVGQGFSYLTLLAAAVYGVHELVKRDDKPDTPPQQKGPEVTSDSSKTTCTGVPCPGAPGVSPLRSGNNGLMFNPANGLVGWRFTLPRR